MKIRDERRTAAIDRMADYILVHGLAAANLRDLASAAGTSDRMLLYYFKDKSELMATTLTTIAERLTRLLDNTIPAGARLPYASLLKAVWGIVGSESLRPFMRLWMELAANATRGGQPHQPIAAAIIDGFAAWIADHLDAAEGQDRLQQAALLLATVDGLLLLDAVGRREIAEQAIPAV